MICSDSKTVRIRVRATITGYVVLIYLCSFVFAIVHVFAVVIT